MATVKELYDYLNSLFPKSLSCDWDNDGLMCANDINKDVKKVLITLDITNPVITYAVDNGFDVILSHHPLIFKSIKSVAPDLGVPSKIIRLIENRICAMSFHTRLDAVKDGVNDALAEALDLSEVIPFGTGEVKLGRVGSLPRIMTNNELADYIKTKLGAPYVNYSGKNCTIATLAILGGAGSDEIADALSSGADAYLTGELGHHDLTDAEYTNMTLFSAGHYHTEFPVCGKLKEIVNAHFPEIYAEIIESLSIRSV